ncbi:MAG: UMP kinase [SAR324 cluster bacterium]|jgi:uridylate kinase|uniref:Uridylate kinase n=1 Tax=marine metagenome TaxID=408172 RepID=A0A381TJB8_9ZZZZ|nr:UMP kinase [SAR324 cluster bacterium]MDP6319344.1 UMP kinase [SAR324 cluster bacterium]
MTPKYKRILLKLSGETLGGEQGSGFDYDTIRSLAESVIAVHNLNVEVGIVIGGGNIFRGARSTDGNIGRVAGDHMGMLATVINSICLQEMLEQRGVLTRVLSAIELNAIAEPYIKRRADRHLEKKRVVIFAAGTGNPYFTTDTAAVLRASEVGAEIVIKATKTNGVYDKDPLTHSDAVRYVKLNYDEVLNKNLQVMDATAIAFCRDNKLPIMVLDYRESETILKAVCGESVGTLIK